MNTRALAYVALKLLGLYCFFQFLFQLPYVFFTLSYLIQETHMAFMYEGSSSTLFWPGMVAVFGVVALFVFSISLYWGAEALSRSMVPNEGEMAWGSPGGSETVIRVGFQFLGVYALIHWIPNLMEVLPQALLYRTMDKLHGFGHSNTFFQVYSKLISPLIGTAVGIFLIFRPQELVRLIRLARPMADVKGEKEDLDAGPE